MATIGEKAEESKMYRIHKTLMEMLRDRDYLVSEIELNMTKEHFLQKHGPELRADIRRTKRNDDSKQILITFKDQLSTKTMRDTQTMMKKEGIDTVIFVVGNKVAPLAMKEIKSCTKYQFQVFKEMELLFNVTKHRLVPEHKLITGDEKKTLLEKYNLKERQLPRIQEDDPVARYYGLRPGQVVKITRPSETAGKCVTYR